MSNIKILDCTLRDGGYVNNWNFGKETIEAISKYLAEAGVDIIEVGFLTDKPHTPEDSLFSTTEELEGVVQTKKSNMLAGMIALGEKEISPLKLEDSQTTGLDIIRITFHNDETEINRAVAFANILKSKGYKVCMQPVGTTSYSDKELVDLIGQINKLQPYAFYLVDTLGTLHLNKLLHFVKLIDKNLDMNIRMGFHSHNNYQMSYANAQQLIEYPTKREILIDSSILGMGRGAGNLCTELVVDYLNEFKKANYNLVPILDAIDNHIHPLHKKLKWGYNAHYFVSARQNCHPSYSTLLMNLQTLTMNEVNLLLQSLPKEDRPIFKKKLIEDLYLKLQQSYHETNSTSDNLPNIIKDDEVLLLGAGHSLIEYKDEIQRFIEQEHPVVIAVNTQPKDFDVHYLFVSNRKRFFNLDYDSITAKIIRTSNLPNVSEDHYCVDFDSLCDKEFEQSDNAGMMLLRLMVQLGIKKATLAGFDGFSSGKRENYYSETIADHTTEEIAKHRTADVAKQIQKIAKEIKIEFLTPSLYMGSENGKQKI